jgi:5-methylcytosine-specific restriction endonuclease McrA
MLTEKIFDERVTALWDSQRRMAAPKKWKSGPRAGSIRRGASPIHFTKADLRAWLWTRVGLNAVQCRYCRAPIDIVSLTPDHIIPRSLGGEFTLENMDPLCCHDCNQRKNNMTQVGFVNLLDFARRVLSPHDASVLLKNLKAAHQGSPSRFFRDKQRAETQNVQSAQLPTKPPPPAKQKDLDWF